MPVVMTDKPVVERPAGTSQTMPGLKRISKLQEVVGPPPISMGAAPAPAPVAAAPAARPVVMPVMPKPRAATPPRGVAVTPPAGTPATPPKLPPLPKLRAATAPPAAIPSELADAPSASVEVDMTEGSDASDDDGPKTHVGPPPLDTIDDEVPPLELPSPQVRPTTQPPVPVLELEPEPSFDIYPEDAADIEKRKRKKRLTEGWDE